MEHDSFKMLESNPRKTSSEAYLINIIYNSLNVCSCFFRSLHLQPRANEILPNGTQNNIRRKTGKFVLKLIQFFKRSSFIKQSEYATLHCDQVFEVKFLQQPLTNSRTFTKSGVYSGKICYFFCLALVNYFTRFTYKHGQVYSSAMAETDRCVCVCVWTSLTITQHLLS